MPDTALQVVRSKEIVTAMALHHEAVVGSLITSMPVKVIIERKRGRPKSMKKLIIAKHRIMINRLMLIVNN